MKGYQRVKEEIDNSGKPEHHVGLKEICESFCTGNTIIFQTNRGPVAVLVSSMKRQLLDTPLHQVSLGGVEIVEKSEDRVISVHPVDEGMVEVFFDCETQNGLISEPWKYINPETGMPE